MTEYALLISGIFSEIRNYDIKPDDIPHKGVTWHDVRREYGIEYTGLENGVWMIRTVDPATLPPPVPSTITPRQVRLLLLQQGKLADVEAMIAQQGEATRITWEYALEFNRNDPLLAQLAAGLGITDEQLDQFFILASRL